MTLEEFEFILDDRIAKIKAINEQYNLLDNSYIAFSGGKDSTILHYLIDLALPNNRIPRVFLNTGLEYNMLVKYVKDLAKQDYRFVILNSKINIKNMLNKYGFPFKSKQHSHNIAIYQNSGLSRCVRVYLGKDVTNEGKDGFLRCPKAFEYNFTEDFKIKCSDKCCYYLKKKPSLDYAKEHNKSITITGMRMEEGGVRRLLGCLTSKGTKFHPLIVVSEEWEKMFIEYFNIKLCKLYYAPFSFERTGCKGCPFTLKLQEQLDTMEKLLPNERKQCEIIWKPVYDEYRRINYRLKGE